MKEIEITCKLGKELSADEIQTAAVKALGVSPKMKSQLKYRILRRSIDARNDILYRYRVEVCRPDEVLPEYVLDEYQDVSAAEQQGVHPLQILPVGFAAGMIRLVPQISGFIHIVAEIPPPLGVGSLVGVLHGIVTAQCP